MEADTYWKIRDYEKLLAERPTLNYVRSAMEEEGRNVFGKARVYVDDEVEKIKDNTKGVEAKMKQLGIVINGDIRDLRTEI